MSKATFHLRVMSLVRMLFEGQVESVYLAGDQGEYELLPFHHPLMGALPEGEILVKDRGSIPIRAGVVMFERSNRCTIIVEEKDTRKALMEG